MVQRLKEEASINRFQIVGLVIAVLSIIALMANAWVLTLLVAVVELTLVGYGYVLAFRFDPNARSRTAEGGWQEACGVG
jgi:hypothetical protein